MFQDIIFQKNKKNSYRSLNNEDKINIFLKTLLLENDTNDIIEYVEYQKIKKKNTILGIIKMIKKEEALLQVLYKVKSKRSCLFKKYKPWGVILFSRNIASISQSKN